MAATLLRTNAGALALAAREKTAMVSSKLRLFSTNLNITLNTVAADLVAAEATYDGYAAIVVAAMLAPVFDPLGGVSIETGTQQFTYVDGDDHVANMIFGCWHETTAGVLLQVIKFDTAIPMATNGQGIPIDVKYLFPAQ